MGKRDGTEKLLAGALLRAASLKGVPYMIGTDLNFDPALSEVLRKTFGKELMYDIIHDYYCGDPPPTFCRKGISDEVQGDGVTRKDTILASPAAADAFCDCENLHDSNGSRPHANQVPN